ncbi:hypothetical protein JFL43_17815 [Viridibacillus sp. YIM B01967]|uniref:Uncharacterized protein n=1 Tax=Viridibacillus soli TaxID=2798301 RepID=A0ABS1HB96_9BACL|nr:hypothetical protein [Viridibacillus soli]MBK3496684.1 hypothetical protein [Viridibacillus soli]
MGIKVIKRMFVVISMFAFSLIVLVMPNNASAAELEISLEERSSIDPLFINDYRNVKKMLQLQKSGLVIKEFLII